MGTNRDAHSVRAQEDLWRMLLLGHTIQDAARAQQTRVARRPRTGQDDKVDNVGDNLDTCARSRNDKGTRRSRACATEKVLVI